MSNHIVNQLAQKRGELLGEAEELQSKLEKIKDNLCSLDKTILIFDPDYQFSKVKPIHKRKAQYFGNGELKQLVCNLLKNHQDGLMTNEIQDYLISTKGIAFETQGEINKFKKNVFLSLEYYRNNGLLSCKNDGSAKKWSIRNPNSQEL